MSSGWGRADLTAAQIRQTQDTFLSQGTLAKDAEPLAAALQGTVRGEKSALVQCRIVTRLLLLSWNWAAGTEGSRCRCIKTWGSVNHGTAK